MPRFRLLLRDLRTASSLSQEELARALQVSRQSIISLERGEYLPSAPVLISLMEFFGCSLPELIEGVNLQSSEPAQQIIQPELVNNVSSVGIGALNLYESETHFEIEVQLPGFVESEINLEMRENMLTIRAEKELTLNDETRSAIRQEWQTGQFERSIRFETPIQDSAIEAKLENGTLTVIAPKAKPTEPKTTRIQVKRS